MSRARQKIIAAVESKGYSVAELTWQPWGKAVEKEGISGGWWGRVVPDPSPPGSSGLGWFGGLSWQEAVEFIEQFLPDRATHEGEKTPPPDSSRTPIWERPGWKSPPVEAEEGADG